MPLNLVTRDNEKIIYPNKFLLFLSKSLNYSLDTTSQSVQNTNGSDISSVQTLDAV